MTIKLKTAIATALIGCALLANSLTAFAEDVILPHDRQPFFGDLHVHTNQSLDSYQYYNANTPDDAYYFAKGENTLPIGDSGVTVKISKPLDFAAVTDHAESMVEYYRCVENKDSSVYDSTSCGLFRDRDEDLYGIINDELQEKEEPKRDEGICPEGKEDADCLNASITMWQGYQNVANNHNMAKDFTAFIAYEHSPLFIRDGSFHRNIIFRGTVVPNEVLSAYDVYTPQALWERLENTCSDNDANPEENCQVLVIPHNPNMAKGMFFAEAEPKAGTPYTQEDYERRNRLEPLIEIHQAKGNSECRLGVGTTDEFCQFESSVTRSCDADFADVVPGSNGVNCLEDSFVRNGLKKGLKLAKKIEMNGLNPFKYGFIGSTDTHNSASGLTAEFQRVGNTVLTATAEERLFGDGRLGRAGPVKFNPGGLAGVWAEKNSREAIFDALQRKEAFGTSGSRIKVRFFAGRNYPINLDKYPKETMLKKAYENGTPMGGDIDDSLIIYWDIPPYKFLVWAVKDPNSANLQRLQIIKGWEDINGIHEKVYDVACSDGLEPDKWTHRCPDNGAKVDLESCNYSENKGATELKTTWVDPDFDPSHRAFYYVRVLENPTCRWSTYDAKELGIELLDIPPTIQERAWSSPIWYTPGTTTKQIIVDRINEIIKKRGGIKALIEIIRNLLEDKKRPLLQAFVENKKVGGQKLSTPVLKALLQSGTVTYLNRRDGSIQETVFTQNGKRVVDFGPDNMLSTSYEIRDNQLYQRSGDNEYGTSIYRMRGKSGFHYIACDSRDNGYCNWEIIRPPTKGVKKKVVKK